MLVIEEGWPTEPDMRKRWAYTAVTRAERELTVAGWLGSPGEAAPGGVNAQGCDSC